eukprot:TRINITY_DN13236_c0_g1_i1.p1 TRINITY_DN13236_c0_g1~~TRINITY_DN13236_c0_g1_i1.p1  ORF type:complete len:279 (+),score=125.64 TRINITY_DN13236_c0_g1_i1:73-909(+)
MDLQQHLSLMKEIALQAGDIIMPAFKEKKLEDNDESLQFKGNVDLVTQTDKEVEKYIKDTLSKEYPDYSFLGEEETSQGLTDEILSDNPTWVCDPIDGTTNFVHRYPFIAVSLSLCVNKKPVVGVVFNPVLNEMFCAAKGFGATLNDEPINVSVCDDIGSAVVGTNIGYNRTPLGCKFLADNVQRLLSSKVRSIRMGGSAALEMCSVACGRQDSYYEWGIHAWDITAAAVIIEEAGGVVVDPSNQEIDYCNRRVLCGSKEICDILTEILNIDIPEGFP